MRNDLWWLSFADINLPRGQQFLGVVIIEAADSKEALLRSHALNVNPGGQVRMLPLPSWLQVDAKWLKRLLSRQECDEVDAEFTKQWERVRN